MAAASPATMQAFSHKPQPVHTSGFTVGVKRPPRRVAPAASQIARPRIGQALTQLVQMAAPMKL
jgi:hypothetical protein